TIFQNRPWFSVNPILEVLPRKCHPGEFGWGTDDSKAFDAGQVRFAKHSSEIINLFGMGSRVRNYVTHDDRGRHGFYSDLGWVLRGGGVPVVFPARAFSRAIYKAFVASASSGFCLSTSCNSATPSLQRPRRHNARARFRLNTV